MGVAVGVSNPRWMMGRRRVATPVLVGNRSLESFPVVVSRYLISPLTRPRRPNSIFTHLSFPPAVRPHTPTVDYCTPLTFFTFHSPALCTATYDMPRGSVWGPSPHARRALLTLPHMLPHFSHIPLPPLAAPFCFILLLPLPPPPPTRAVCSTYILYLPSSVDFVSRVVVRRPSHHGPHTILWRA